MPDRMKHVDEEPPVSQEQFVGIIMAAMDAIISVDSHQTIKLFNPAAERMFGWTSAEIVGQPLDLLIPPRYRSVHGKHIAKFGQTGVTVRAKGKLGTLNGLRKDNTEFPVEASISQVEVEGRKTYSVILRDITERKHFEEQLEYQASLIRNVSDAIISTDMNLIIESWNKAAEIMYGWLAEEVLGKPTTEILHSEYEKGSQQDALRKLIATGSWDGEVIQRRKDGTRVNVLASVSTLRDLSGTPIGNVTVNRDITERKQAEENLRESEQRFRMMFASNPLPMWVYDAESLEFLEVNEAATVHYGYSRDEFLSMLITDIRPTEDVPRLHDTLAQPRPTIRSSRGWKHRKKNDELIDVQITSHAFQFSSHEQSVAAILVVAEDITERKRAEETVAFERYLLNSLMESTPDSIYFKDTVGKFTRINRSLAESVGLTDPAEAIGKSDSDFFSAELARSSENDEQEIIRTGIPILSKEEREKWADGHETWVLTTKLPLRDPQGDIAGIIGVSRDITERKQAEEETQQHLRRLASLRNIDLAISGNLDLRVTLNVILDHVTSQLGVDAAAVLLLDPHTQILQYATGRGFRTKEIERSQLRLGEGYAGNAILGRRMITIPSLENELNTGTEGGFVRALLFSEEKFVSYFGAPLIAKGQSRGILELFHRTPLEPDEKWLDFFEMLAGQAAIGIDNAQLFEDLQRSNSRLSLAYDTTIEGWSRALDLRDKETEGHTQRVTAMTLRLAQAMGIESDEMAQIRRGALLHDIGKVGVPDGVLLKPGPLTDEEWAIMRKHPIYAYELLSPIAYLRRALDIPYAHHEKWDGTGYPRGLKGEQIPLAARIFAVVDVWDALRSDRPYRAAWPKARVRDYISEQAGTHFDPKVVAAFLEILS